MIVVPIISNSNKAAVKDIKEAGEIADIIEIRLDHIKNPCLEVLIKNSPKPVIVTNRCQSEGGKFPAREKERLSLLKKAVFLNADYIDIELKTGKRVINDLLAARRLAKNKSQIIVSYHNFKKTPRNLKFIYEKIKKTGCDIIKIATYARSINDNLIIFELIKRAKKERKRIIALCMGERGEISRVLGPIFGSFFAFGSLGAGKESAPGQISAQVLKRIYRINKLKNKNLKIYGLVGNPVNKSSGYLIHNLVFSKLGLNAIYVNFLVDDLGLFLKKYKRFFNGLSITMPFKEKVLDFLDKIDPVAKSIGAVNTVVVKNGKLIGYNTDSPAAVCLLEQKTKIQNKKIVILGGGGAAKAIAWGLKNKGAKLTILNRTVSKAKELARNLECNYGNLSQINKLDFDILVNATSLGMAPAVEQTPVKNKKILTNKIIFESVYNPVNTRLLKDAQKVNAQIINGWSFFLNQAALQFKLWTGKNMPISLIEKLVKKSEE